VCVQVETKLDASIGLPADLIGLALICGIVAMNFRPCVHGQASQQWNVTRTGQLATMYTDSKGKRGCLDVYGSGGGPAVVWCSELDKLLCSRIRSDLTPDGLKPILCVLSNSTPSDFHFSPFLFLYIVSPLKGVYTCDGLAGQMWTLPSPTGSVGAIHSGATNPAGRCLSNGKTGTQTTINAYTDLPYVEMFVNGESMGVQKIENPQVGQSWYGRSHFLFVECVD
jgi:hypothetical protein